MFVCLNKFQLPSDMFSLLVFGVWLAVVPDQLWGLAQACLNVFFGVFRGLPSKSPEEEENHRLQYEAMIEAAKRKGTSPTLIVVILVYLV